MRRSSGSDGRFGKGVPGNAMLRLSSAGVHTGGSVTSELVLVATLRDVRRRCGVPLGCRSLSSYCERRLSGMGLKGLRFHVSSISVSSAHCGCMRSFTRSDDLIQLRGRVRARVFPVQRSFSGNVRTAVSGPCGLVVLRVQVFLVKAMLLLFVIVCYLMRRVGIVIGRGGVTGVHRSFSCTVVRSVGAPLDSVLVNAHVLHDKGLSSGPRQGRGCFSVVRSRRRRLLTLIGGMLALSGLRRNGLLLRGGRMDLHPVVRSLARGFATGTRGPIRFVLSLRRRGMCTSRRFLGRTIDGLVSGTVGCSRRDMRVGVSSSTSSGKCARVDIGSGNVNVPLGRRKGVFRGFRHTSTMRQGQGKKTPNFKLKLGCMFRIMQTRRKDMGLRDVRKRCDRFAVGVPRRGGRVM